MGNVDDHPGVKMVYELMVPSLAAIAGSLVDDADAAVVAAAAHFDDMVPDLAYRDDPGHVMAASLFTATANLAMWLALRDRGVGVHDFGRTALEAFARHHPFADVSVSDLIKEGVAAGAASQADARPGEFVFEVLTEGDDFDVAVNIMSCGICSQFSKYDAMDLVPYMCAMDDVMSDGSGDGLRRTGTIALGADHCDFRYQRGGEPKRVADQYPDRVQIPVRGSG